MARADELLYEWLCAALGIFPNPDAVPPQKSALTTANKAVVLYDASKPLTRAQSVIGRYYHAVQFAYGGDTFKIQGDAGNGFADIAGQTGLTGTTEVRQFTGAYLALQVVRTAGSGNTSKATLYSIR